MYKKRKRCHKAIIICVDRTVTGRRAHLPAVTLSMGVRPRRRPAGGRRSDRPRRGRPRPRAPCSAPPPPPAP